MFGTVVCTEPVSVCSLKRTDRSSLDLSLSKKSDEVEFYIRATKPVRSKWGRCQSGARWQGTENAARLPLCPRVRPLRVRNKLSGASRASSPPGHGDAAAPQPACQTRDTISSSPGARVCPGPPSFFSDRHARVNAIIALILNLNDFFKKFRKITESYGNEEIRAYIEHFKNTSKIFLHRSHHSDPPLLAD